MVIGFLCHVIGTLVIIFAQGYWSLYIGTFILALGNGTVEAYINPVVATQFSKSKTKWLSILHAGWPGGLVLAGVLALLLADSVGWRVKFALVFIPTIIYFILLLVMIPLATTELGLALRTNITRPPRPRLRTPGSTAPLPDRPPNTNGRR